MRLPLQVVSKLTLKGKSESVLFTSSGLYCNKSKKEAELEKKVEKLTAEVKSLKERQGRGQQGAPDSSNSRGRGGARGGRGGRGGQRGQKEGPSIQQKTEWTCPDFNSGGCSEPCPKNLRHSCNFVNGETLI